MTTSAVETVLGELQIASENPGACAGPGAWSAADSGRVIESVNPAQGEPIASIRCAVMIPYLFTSERVRNTFRDRPAADEGLG